MTPHETALKIYESAALVLQYRFPRSKKRRIQNKWKLRRENFRPDTRIFVNQRDGTAICHPVIAAKIREEAARDAAKSQSNPLFKSL